MYFEIVQNKIQQMATIISIETSTNVCSACLSVDGRIVANKEDHQGQNHSSVLGGFVKELVETAKNQNMSIDAVAVSCGPGSYTGLRIGVSTAKGLAFGLDAKLISVSTLKTIAGSIARTHQELNGNAWICPMIDARRMEVYNAFFNTSLGQERDTAATIVDENSFCDILAERQVVFCGNGAPKCKNAITHSNAIFIDDADPLAKDMVPLAEALFHAGKFEDIAYFEPYYLKEFVAEHSQKKLW